MVLQGVEEQGKVDEVVASCKSLELAEMDLLVSSVGEISGELASPGDLHSLEDSEHEFSAAGNGARHSARRRLPTCLPCWMSS